MRFSIKIEMAIEAQSEAEARKAAFMLAVLGLPEDAEDPEVTVNGTIVGSWNATGEEL